MTWIAGSRLIRRAMIPGYTQKRRPVILIWSEHFAERDQAFAPSARSRDGAVPRRRR